MGRSNYVVIWSEAEPPWRRDVPLALRFAVRWGVTVLALLAADLLVTGIEIDGWPALLIAAAILVVARAVLRPVLILLTCPLQLLTLGLALFLVNALILAFTAWLCDLLGIAFEVDGFLAAFLGALVVSGVSFLLDRVVRSQAREIRGA
jgi:putative membrane protein